MRIRLTQSAGISGTTYPTGTVFLYFPATLTMAGKQIRPGTDRDVIELSEDVVNSLRIHNAFEVVPDPPPPPAEVSSENQQPKKPAKQPKKTG